MSSAVSSTPAAEPAGDPDTAASESQRDRRAGVGLSGQLATVLADYRAALATCRVPKVPHAG